MLLLSVRRHARMPRDRWLILMTAALSSALGAHAGAAQNPCEGWATWDFWRTVDPPTIRGCIARGYSVSDRSDGMLVTPLHRAAALSDDPEVVRVLVEAGASLEAVLGNGRTPLHSAARYNENLEVLRALLRYEPDVYARNDEGRTPLHLAALFNNSDIVEELARVTDVNVTTWIGETPLHSATRSRGYQAVPNPSPDVVAVLLRRGADLAAEADGGATPMLWADDGRVVEMIQEEEVRRDAIRERFLRYVATRVAVGTVALAVLVYVAARLGRAGRPFATG